MLIKTESNQQSIFFCVCIPVYNARAYLEECLESILLQDYKRYKIYLVDDCSSDGSSNICDYYAMKYRNVIHVSHNVMNLGAYCSRERAYVDAKRDCELEDKYILFMDADDELESANMFSFLCKKIIESNFPEVVVYGYDAIDENSNLLNINPAKSHEHLLSSYEILNDLANGLELLDLMLWNKVIKIEALESVFQIKDQQLKLCEDTVLFLNVLNRADNIYFLPESFYGYRKHSDSITKTVSLETGIVSKGRFFNLLEREIEKRLCNGVDPKAHKEMNYQRIKKQFGFTLARFCMEELVAINHIESSKERFLLLDLIRLDKNYSSIFVAPPLRFSLFFFLWRISFYSSLFRFRVFVKAIVEIDKGFRYLHRYGVGFLIKKL